MRLPAVAGPSSGINVTEADLPVVGLVTRPGCSDLTRGVFSHNPGSVALPRLATVVPNVAPALAGARVAASRSAAVVVSSASALAPEVAIGEAAGAGAATSAWASTDASADAAAAGACSGWAVSIPKRSARLLQPAVAATMNSGRIIRVMLQDYLCPAPLSIAQMPLAPHWAEHYL